MSLIFGGAAARHQSGAAPEKRVWVRAAMARLPQLQRGSDWLLSEAVLTAAYGNSCPAETIKWPRSGWITRPRKTPTCCTTEDLPSPHFIL